ncbi:MAG: hypothetical protein Q4A65_07140 [Bacillota bacterium]|nr:hypothetical protein [Bacillota bacterium]
MISKKHVKAIDSIDPPDKFLAWCYQDGKEFMREDLKGSGYKTEKIGETHTSEIYLCTR